MLPLFKVLVDGKPVHGGSGKYPPPGEWTPNVTPIVCKSGYHLTSDPLLWWKPGAVLWLAEGRGIQSNPQGDKIAFESVRLIAEVTKNTSGVLAYPRIIAFLAASEGMNSPSARANLAGANLARANLAGANLARAYRPQGGIPGWKANEAGLLVQV